VTDEVLLVEDDPEAARRIGCALAEHGFVVHRVLTGEEAIDQLATRGAACAVLDAALPLTDGLETLRRLRARRIATPVVMTVDPAAVDLAVRAVKIGAADVVEKRGDFVTTLAAKVRDLVADASSRTRRGRLVRPVFVGRESELRFLCGELGRASGGEGRVVLVTGDNGIGKTSLALDFARTARERGALVLWGHCDETHGAPAYWPWTEILRGYAGTVDPASVREAVGPAAAAIASLVPSLRTAEPAPTAEASEVTRFQLFDGVTQFLRQASARRPLVCVFDDLHQADGDSLRLLRFLAPEIADAHILIVGAYRDAELVAGVRAELGRIADHPVASAVRLGAFDETDVWRYIADATDVRPAKTLVRAIVAKTEGNPLFVAEVVSLLAADGRLGDDPGDGEVKLAIPETRRQAIADRLARLSEPCRLLLGAAAVVGTDFDAELLGQATGVDRPGVRAALDEAVEQRLVVAGESIAELRFSNVLVRDVLVDCLPAAERQRLHARIADVLDATTAGSPERPFGAIAHHRLEGAISADDVRQALGCLAAAAERAAALMAHEEAARFYETAIRVGDRGRLLTPAAQAALLVRLAEARWRAGDMEAAREVGRRALGLATDAGEPETIAAAALVFAGRLPGFGAIVCDDEVVAALEQALALLPGGAPALRAQVMARLAEELAYSPRRGVERALGQQAIELARRVDDPAVLAAVLRTTQWSVWTPDDVERRRLLAEEIVALARRTGERMLALDGELLRLWSALERADMDFAWRQLGTCVRLAGELRLPYYAWVTATARACLHIATARLDDAEQLAAQAHRIGERSGDLTVALFGGVQREHVKFLRGRFDEVAEWLGGVLRSFPLLVPAVDCSLIITYAQSGQHDRARAELARYCSDDFAAVPRNAMWLMNMAFLADACVMIGDAEVAARLYPHLAPFTPYNVTLPPAFVLGPVSHYIAGLAALMGNDAAARRHYEDALALEARTGSRQWTARSQIEYGRWLLTSRHPDPVRGAQLVASARAIAEELGLAPIIALADATVLPERPPAPDARRCRFHRKDDEWEIEFQGRRASLRHRVGMEYLRHLLERPGVPVAALELASAGGRGVLVENGGGPLLDRRAVLEVQGRVAEIEAEIDACTARNVAPAHDLRAELAQCRGYLDAQAGGLVSAIDRARPSVTKAIDRAIAAITEVHGVLGHHLSRHVETGRACVYVPDPAAPVRFDF
jgi:ActR/RegA family two-component response regulator/tetratricopeptide (TPR) repeat protein